MILHAPKGGGVKALKRKEYKMIHPFHRDFYNTVKDAIFGNSVSFLMGPWKCGKTVCLRQIYEELGNSEYVDFKTVASNDDKTLEVFGRIFQAIKSNEDRVFLLDGITHIDYADFQIKELARIFDDYSNDKTKIVIAGSQSVALNAWANHAFGKDAGYIYVDFLTYTEFMKYKGVEEDSTQISNAFLYDSAAFHNITSLKEYLTRCIEETIISNEHAMEYIFNNDVFLIEDKIDFLIGICYQALFPLLNKTLSGIDQIRQVLQTGYAAIQDMDIKTMKQALIFLKRCGLITISPITEDNENVPNIYRDLISDYSKINYSNELFHGYTIDVTHPLFYVLILKEILKEDMPEAFPDPVVKRIMDYHYCRANFGSEDFHTKEGI